MIRRYCDHCECEITNNNKIDDISGLNRVNTKLVNEKTGMELTIEVLQVKNNHSNRGDFCKYCIFDSFKKLDDRPRAP